MSWLEDISLRDLEETTLIEATCFRCLHVWVQSPVQILIKVSHRDVRLDEVAKNLPCPRPGCRHTGVRLALISNEETSGFVAGLP